jgi:hypothetical protein
LAEIVSNKEGDLAMKGLCTQTTQNCKYVFSVRGNGNNVNDFNMGKKYLLNHIQKTYFHYLQPR